MKKPRVWFGGLLYRGDWHTSLLDALALAKEGTQSPEISDAVAHLQQLLHQNDECVHTITVREPAPVGIDREFLAACLQQEPWAAESVEFEAAGILAVTMTHRGSRHYANHVASDCVSRALRDAKRRATESI